MGRRKNILVEGNGLVDNIKNSAKGLIKSGLNAGVDKLGEMAKNKINGMGLKQLKKKAENILRKHNNNLEGKGLFGDIGGAAGGMVGSRGGFIGSRVGNFLGNTVGNKVDNLLGTGLRMSGSGLRMSGSGLHMNVKGMNLPENNKDYIPRNVSVPQFYTKRRQYR